MRSEISVHTCTIPDPDGSSLICTQHPCLIISMPY